VGIPIHARTGKREIPADFRDVAYEWVEVPVDEETVLRGIFIRNDGPPVLVLYGSGMGIAGIRELLRSLRDAGYSVLCCDYRGTGHSSGRWWTSRHLDDDARILYEWLRRKARTEDVGVVGVSIGAIAAAPLIARPDAPACVGSTRCGGAPSSSTSSTRTSGRTDPVSAAGGCRPTPSASGRPRSRAGRSPWSLRATRPRRNGMLTLENPCRRVTYELTRKQARKLGPLFAVRAVPEGFITTVGTQWFGGRIRRP
jgi:pimeloyl-ACP methyl ester carboxylesterase